MGSLRGRVEEWIRDQTARAGLSWPSQPPALPLPRWRWGWPPWRGQAREEERAAREEYERRRRQLRDLCRAVKAESVAELQEILCCMVLSECVYKIISDIIELHFPSKKRPDTEMVRFINKFKSDFGGQIVSLECVQPSLDHVPHRYLLAEAGDTLFASFIGTKQYKDVIADVNILQGAIFHEDIAEDFVVSDVETEQVDSHNKTEDSTRKLPQTRPKNLGNKLKPAAHRGFLARAKGIPALELYKLAQKKNRKLVLCGHSLGGAVAALATLAILRVLASSPLSKDQEKVQVKCITFSQPPVGNAALRDYVHQKGWQHYFKSYCIPEDLVPRILSPAYFHHYNAQTLQPSPDPENTVTSFVKSEEVPKRSYVRTPKDHDGEQLVLGLGPVQTSFWRLSKLVPLEGVKKTLNIFKRVGDVSQIASSTTAQGLQLAIDETDAEPQSLEIQESSDGISLTPLPDTERGPGEPSTSQTDGNGAKSGDSRRWQRVPYLPSYVPFGQLYLLGNSSVELLSEAEYSKLTSMKSVITELRERFQSHSMKSYRSRFQKMYDLCMSVNASPFSGIDQLPQFPHLQQWLGLAAAGAVELHHIVEPSVIRTATSILPLGWSGVPGNKDSEPLKVDIIGHGLHLCTLVQARINGKWCSTAVESFPSMPPYELNHHLQPNLQKMRIIIGAPLKQPPKYPVVEDSLFSMYSAPVADCVSSTQYKAGSCSEERIKGLDGFVIYCTNDFVSVSKEVHVRTRRVRLLGFEGAGKTSLFNAIMSQSRQKDNANLEFLLPQDIQEGVAGGLCYVDSPGVNLQELHLEATRFMEELQIGFSDPCRKTDLVILVHNVSQKVPQYCKSSKSQPQPALSLLLDDAKALGVPWVLAITNKFSVSAHQQKLLISSAMEAYKATPSMTEVINSCPFMVPVSPQSQNLADEKFSKVAAQSFVLAPINLARMPFQKKSVIMPVEGVTALNQLVHRVLRSHEQTAFQELADKRLSLELAREQDSVADARHDLQGKESSMTAAAVGASLGAGLGLVMAVVMGAASALRKP